MGKILQVWFDLDNTLSDRNAAMEEALRVWITRYALEPDPSTLDSQIQKCMQEDRWGYTPRPVFASWLLQHIPSRWNKEVPALVNELLMGVAAHTKPYPYTREVLAFCKSRGPIGLLTNGPSQVQRAKIASAGIAEFFEEKNMLVTGEFGFHKPSYQAFQQMISVAGVSAENILYVGDDPHNDVWGAQQVAMPHCWISHGRRFSEHSIQPDYIAPVCSAEHLIKLLEG
ncbi:MAG: HAD family hydrolase [Cytophagaceae bacterium]|jgi:putative hydrolase of the HAD superfamily|nr:HAD family hydrolase [Cytophagaceae bacterium]